MQIEVECTTCKTPHFSHYACSNCGHRISNFICTWGKETPEQLEEKRKELWKYCPWCGEKL